MDLTPVASSVSTASDVTFVPAGTIAATNVQSAIQEVASDAASALVAYYTSAEIDAFNFADASQVLAVQDSLDLHVADTSNPHAVTAAQAGAQPLDATLTALAGVTTAANKLIYATGVDTFTTADFTATARSLLDDASTSAMLTTLGAAGTGVANTFSAQQVFQTGAAGASPVIFRQTGGVAGTDELQIGHDGTLGLIESKDGVLKVKTATATTSSAIFTTRGGSIAAIASDNASFRLIVDGTLAAANSSSGWSVNNNADLTPGANTYQILWSDTSVSRDAANILYVQGDSATGVAPTLRFKGKSSTTSGRATLDVATSWIVSTDASRTARADISVWDTAARLAIRLEASGTAAKVGFFGAAAVVQQSAGTTATDAASTQTLANALRTALVNLGLIA